MSNILTPAPSGWRIVITLTPRSGSRDPWRQEHTLVGWLAAEDHPVPEPAYWDPTYQRLSCPSRDVAYSEVAHVEVLAPGQPEQDPQEVARDLWRRDTELTMKEIRKCLRGIPGLASAGPHTWRATAPDESVLTVELVGQDLSSWSYWPAEVRVRRVVDGSPAPLADGSPEQVVPMVDEGTPAEVLRSALEAAPAAQMAEALR